MCASISMAALRGGQLLLLGLMSVNLLISLISLMSQTSQKTQCIYDYASDQPRAHREYYASDDTNRQPLNSEIPSPASYTHAQNGSLDTPRIFCWIMTMPANLRTKAWAVYNTWAKRCNSFIFVSSQPSRFTPLPLLILNVTEERKHLTAKTMQAFHHIYRHHFHEADWFVKADDDTYLIVENLRHFLSDKDANKAVYFGGKISNVPWAGHVRSGYNAGGPGYVLSREAVRRFAVEGIKDPNLCSQDGAIEDVDLGFCLEKLNVKLGHTDDKFDRLRFHNFNPQKQMVQMHQYSPRISMQKEYPFSDSAISFHHVEPAEMYMYDYLLYKLTIYNENHTRPSTGEVFNQR